jgi:hypothetical protein
MEDLRALSDITDMPVPMEIFFQASYLLLFSCKHHLSCKTTQADIWAIVSPDNLLEESH